MYDQVRDHLLGLSDSELADYIATGLRMHEPEAVAFAKEEL